MGDCNSVPASYLSLKNLLTLASVALLVFLGFYACRSSKFSNSCACTIAAICYLGTAELTHPFDTIPSLHFCRQNLF